MIDNEGILERVKQVKAEYKITNLQLAKQCEMKIQSIIQQVYHRNNVNITLPTVVGLVELVPSLDIRWLLTGEKSNVGNVDNIEKNIAEINEKLAKIGNNTAKIEKLLS